jgi:hypothetical protein
VLIFPYANTFNKQIIVSAAYWKEHVVHDLLLPLSKVHIWYHFLYLEFVMLNGALDMRLEFAGLAVFRLASY